MRQWNLYVNPFSLVFGVVSSYVLSTIWYSLIFRKTWVEYSRFNEKQIEDIQNNNKYSKLLTAILATLLTTCIHSVLIFTLPITSTLQLLVLDVVLTVGFVTPIMANSVIWGKGKLPYFAINLSYQFINLFVQGLIIRALDVDVEYKAPLFSLFDM